MINFKELSKKYQTPLYVYDFENIKKNYLELKSAFKGRKSLVCYAVKANSNLSVLKLLAELEAGADCVSMGEVKRALYAGIPKYKIIFSGVGKRDDEIEEAILRDILMINIESEAEFERVELIAAKLSQKARISIRVNPNIDAKTHPYISTGLNENKFGIDIENAKKLYIRAKNSNYIEPVGIHFHIGSQLTDLKPIEDASEIVASMMKQLKVLDIDIKFFDIGGGIGIRYDDEKTIKLYDYAQAVLSTLKGTDVTVVCEPGRYIVGESGYFLTTVLYEKENNAKRFVIVDGGMNDLLRPSLYKAYHSIEAIGVTGEVGKCDVVGPVCESGDFFAKDIELPKLKNGDLLVIKSAGAYGFTMSSNYNSRGRAAEVAVEDGKDRVIRRRENFEDLIRLEKEYV
jgi:diaminopimelate decarboxylase